QSHELPINIIEPFFVVRSSQNFATPVDHIASLRHRPASPTQSISTASKSLRARRQPERQTMSTLNEQAQPFPWSREVVQNIMGITKKNVDEVKKASAKEYEIIKNGAIKFPGYANKLFDREECTAWEDDYKFRILGLEVAQQWEGGLRSIVLLMCQPFHKDKDVKDSPSRLLRFFYPDHIPNPTSNHLNDYVGKIWIYKSLSILGDQIEYPITEKDLGCLNIRTGLTDIDKLFLHTIVKLVFLPNISIPIFLHGVGDYYENKSTELNNLL
ncbi:hypothetical protein BU23DRAFT_659769, partial [Bimuria novae-zelandiae CBS 107.79]